MKEQILLFAPIDAKQRTAVTKALMPQKFRVRCIDEVNFDQPVGLLAGLSADELAEIAASGQAMEPETGAELQSDSQPDAVDEPMLVFAGLSSKRLNLALQRLRAMGVRISYKAVLTPSNANWTAGQLLAELKAEHAAMAAGASSAHG